MNGYTANAHYRDRQRTYTVAEINETTRAIKIAQMQRLLFTGTVFTIIPALICAVVNFM